MQIRLEYYLIQCSIVKNLRFEVVVKKNEEACLIKKVRTPPGAPRAPEGGPSFTLTVTNRSESFTTLIKYHISTGFVCNKHKNGLKIRHTGRLWMVGCLGAPEVTNSTQTLEEQTCKETCIEPQKHQCAPSNRN